jgi:hypothetical protein
MLLLDSSVCGLFKWRQFEPEVILLAIGWYLRFSLSYRDVEELLAERGSVWTLVFPEKGTKLPHGIEDRSPVLQRTGTAPGHG